MSAEGHTVTSFSVRDIAPDDLVGSHMHCPAVRLLRSHVEEAQAVVIATPVYKASFSGALKCLLDLLPENALAGKIILPVATGGSLSHLLALEYALKPVLSALGARMILGGTYATDKDVAVLPDGQVAISRSIQDRLDAAAQELQAELAGRVRRAGGPPASERPALPSNTIVFPAASAGRAADADNGAAGPRALASG